MESVFGRYRNLIVLVGVLFAQIFGLAVQVRRVRDKDSEPTRLIRVWAVGAVTPLEKALAWMQTSSGGIWHNYFYLRGVRAENRELKQEIERMRLEQARISQDADQARRLQALLGFKEQFISQTMAAQVIGGTGSELSRSVYIDKGERDGIKTDMAVISKDGIVGKVLRVYRSTALVLLIDDQTSGVGSILDKSRLQGILRGTSSGEVVLEKVMSDENVPEGEQVLTSGGDGIFPKGLPVGTVRKVSKGSDLFLNIRVRPSADLNRLEEVLVVTKVDERQTEPDQTGAVRAVDILAERLPTVPPKAEPTADGAAKNSVAPGGVAKPAGPAGTTPPAGATVSQSNGEAKPKAGPVTGMTAVTTPGNPGAKTPAGVASAGSPTSKPGTGSGPSATDSSKARPASVPISSPSTKIGTADSGATVVKKNAAPAPGASMAGTSATAGTTKKPPVVTSKSPGATPKPPGATPKPQPTAQSIPQ